MAKCASKQATLSLNGIKHWLFDWGDTLMVDFSQYQGPMCDWPAIALTEHAAECLATCARHGACHLATNAQDSSAAQIRQALQRGGLSRFISHIFCVDTLGVNKSASDYFPRIAAQLQTRPEALMMVGDSLERDIYPALASGLQACWYNPLRHDVPAGIYAINSLQQLIREPL